MKTNKNQASETLFQLTRKKYAFIVKQLEKQKKIQATKNITKQMRKDSTTLI